MSRFLNTNILLLALAAPVAAPAAAGPGSLPEPVIPDAFGVASHTLEMAPASRANGRVSEAGRLSEVAGFVRIDLPWAATEPVSQREKTGDERDNWSRFDAFLRSLQDRQKGAPNRPLNVMFVLDYNNPLYWSREYRGKKRPMDRNKPEDRNDPLAVDASLQVPPNTPEERAAFARWAGKAVEHYSALQRRELHNLRIAWEVWNEPNIAPFWGRNPNAAEYAALVAEAAPAIRKADPNATILVGALSGVDLPYAEEIVRRGVLQHADAFSVHPYGGAPELQAEALRKLRRLVHRHSPDRPLPLVVSEMGYHTAMNPDGVSEIEQARLLVRARLLHLSLGMRGTVIYDWKDDGRNPNEPEHNFGLVTQRFKVAFPFDRASKDGTPRGLDPVTGLTWQAALSPRPDETAPGKYGSDKGPSNKVADIHVKGFRRGDSLVVRIARGYGDDIAPDAEAIGMWVHGDANGDLLHLRGDDEEGRHLGTYGSIAITWRGWRWVSFRLNTTDPATGTRRERPERWMLVLTNAPGTTHDVRVQIDDLGAYRPIFDPKPAFTALRVLNETLNGFSFVHTLVDRRGEYHVLLRERDRPDGKRPRSAVALWSTGRQICGPDGMCDPANAYIVPEGASGVLVDMLGRRKRRVRGGQTIRVEASPQYLVFDERGSEAALGHLDLQASWSWTRPDGSGGDVPLEWTVLRTDRPLNTVLRLGNRTPHRLRYDEVALSIDGARLTYSVRLPIILEPGAPDVLVPVTIERHLRTKTAHARVRILATDLEGGRDSGLAEDTVLDLLVDAPIEVQPSGLSRGTVDVELNAAGGMFPPGPITVTVDSPEYGAGRAELTIPPGGPDSVTVPVMVPGAPRTGSPDRPYSLGVRVSAGGREVVRTEVIRFEPVLSFEGQTAGDAPPGISEDLGGYDDTTRGRTRAVKPEGRKAALIVRDDPVRGKVGEVHLTFRPGWSYVSLIDRTPRTVPPGATAVGMWVNGDNSGDILAINLVGSGGATQQVRTAPVNWTGWRWVVFPINDPFIRYWTVPDGKDKAEDIIRRPQVLQTVLGIDGTRGAANGRTPGLKQHDSRIRFDDVSFLVPGR